MSAWNKARESATCLAAFDASNPKKDAGLDIEPASQLERHSVGSDQLLRMRPSGRYYDEDVWAFRLTDSSVRTACPTVLEIEFFDEGYGVIAARRLIAPTFRGEYVGAACAASYVRLNTGTYRRAAFAFDRAPETCDIGDKPDFEITGLQHLRSIRLLADADAAYWDVLRAEIPHDVPPAVSCARPMQIVCSAEGGLSGIAEYSQEALWTLRESILLAKALGFNAIESYVRWDYVEPDPGRFDWSVYDPIVEELCRYGLKWFPLLIVGSAYTLPKWFHDSCENVGFTCLEHGLSNPIQSIWSPYHKKHVVRFLRAFGAHYEPMGCLQGVRLGPSGNYGESQYPAGGNWGYGGRKMHIHIGMWAGDPYAHEDFRRFLRNKYSTLDRLNEAWNTEFASFDDVCPILPDQCLSKRHRTDLNAWYTDSMSEWCEWWAIEARNAMPNTPIYQSAGGWGAVEIGTDYSAQAKSMLKIHGGIRLTNELDSFHQCFYATRLASTAARLYDIPLGFEPAMGHTARGVAGRIFNCVSNNGVHFFTYFGNVCRQQTAIENWLKHYRFFDLRCKPLVEVAVYYPQTMNFLSSDTFRYLNAWGFNPYAREVRNQIEVDYLDDRLIQEGFLDNYKALVFVWGEYIEKGTLDRMDAWLRAGGTIIFPYFLGIELNTVEDDPTVFRSWMRGDTGAGRFHRYRGDDEPASLYAAYVRAVLLQMSNLSKVTRIALEMDRPPTVFVSVQQDGHLLMLNFSDEPVTVSHAAIGTMDLAPYSIRHCATRL